MTNITFKNQPMETVGTLPKVGSTAPAFTLVRQDLSEVRLSDLPAKKKVLNIFPSLDTQVCSLSVKTFYKELKGNQDVLVVNISKDLPFAQKRFCQTEHLVEVEVLSAFRSSFAKDYGLEIKTGPLAGLCSRAVIVLDENNRILYTEQVPEITQEPDYARALTALLKK